jgi:hypothetical protein
VAEKSPTAHRRADGRFADWNRPDHLSPTESDHI